MIGAILPDVTHLLVEDKKHLLMQELLKELQPEEKDLIQGIRIHIALDAYFHKKYIYPKVAILAREFSLHPSTAEGYTEIALDRLIDKQHPEVARTIRKAALHFNTKSFTLALSKIMEQPVKQVRKAVRDAKLISLFKKPYRLRALVIKALILRKYSRLKVREFNLVKSRKILKRAESLIKPDYQKALEQAIKAIQKKL